MFVSLHSNEEALAQCELDRELEKTNLPNEEDYDNSDQE